MFWFTLVFLLNLTACSNEKQTEQEEKTLEPADETDTNSTDTSDIEDTEDTGIEEEIECEEPPEAQSWNWELDCDNDGLPNLDELEAGALDCNGNSIPDSCEALDLRCTSWGRENYIQYDAGTLPIILSAPHGGTLEPEEIPVRSNASTGSDLRTIELAEAINDGLETLTGRRAHLVICHLHRHRLECNRDRIEGADGHPLGEQAWNEYHQYIESAKDAVIWGYGKGLYIDIHGLSSSRDKIELGYLLSGTQYTYSDSELLHSGYQMRSSFRTLAEESSQTLPELLRGTQSIGAGLEGKGYPVVPSPTNPHPGFDENGDLNPYYNGGYNTRLHSSFYGGPISGLQIEHIWEGVRDTAENRQAYGLALAEVLVPFIENTMGIALNKTSRVDIIPASSQLSENGASTSIILLRRGDLSQSETVSLQLEGSAQPDIDFIDISGEYIFEQGEQIIELHLEPIDDDEPEGQENILLSISGENLILEQQEQPSIWLRDDEQPSIWLHPLEDIQEGESIELRVQRDQCDSALTMPLSMSGTIEEEDFASLPNSIDFQPTQTLATLDLSTIVDGNEEGLEQLAVQLDLASSDYFSGPLIEAESKIFDSDLDTALIGWWKLEAEQAEIMDLVNQRPAKLFPEQGPSIATTSFQHPALHFDGIDDLLWIEDFPLSATNSFSLSFFFRAEPDEDAGYAYIWSHGTYSYRNSINIYLRPSGSLSTAIRGGDESWVYGELEVESNLMDGNWHHYALTVDGDTPMARVYIDGELIVSAARGSGGIDPSWHLHIGARGDMNPNRLFKGDLAKIRVYSRELSETEVEEQAIE